MRYISNILRKQDKIKRNTIITIGLVITIALSLYIGGALYIFNDIISETTDGEVDDSDFIDPDFDLFVEMASVCEESVEDCLPLNYALEPVYDDDYNTIEAYYGGGDAAFATGILLGTEAFRYAVAKQQNNETERLDALRLVKKVLSGVVLLFAVPNGGIGPEYGGILARSFWAPNYTGPEIVGYNDPNPLDIFNGSLGYSDWLWTGYPSTDEYSGIVFGLTRTIIEVADDDPWVKETAELLTQQIVEHFLDTDWLICDANGRTTGQEFSPGVENSGYWVLGFLKMAMLGNPTISKYETLYYHYAYELDYISKLKPPMPLEVFNLFNYFGMNINWLISFNLFESETDPYLRKIYLNAFEEYFYSAVKISRNAWFNAAYMGITRKEDEFVARDIADQLMRFNLSGPLDNRTRVPDLGGARNPIDDEQRGRERYSYWMNFIENTTVGSALYGWISNMLPEPERALNTPKTSDQYHPADIIWQRGPWIDRNAWEAQHNMQNTGISFTLPYYMGMYYEIWI